MNNDTEILKPMDCTAERLLDINEIRMNMCIFRMLSAFIIILAISSAEKFNIRLTETSLGNTGRVDVQRVADDGNVSGWGTICDNQFGDKEALVVCRQLGYRFGKTETGLYRDRHSLFVLDHVICEGNETYLDQCKHSAWKKHHCVSFENFYVGVCCSNESSFGEYMNDTYYSHCPVTWDDARSTCAKANGYVAENGFQNLRRTNNSFWNSQIYTPWLGQIGCFKISRSVHVTKLNGPGTCSQLCIKSAVFGVSGLHCYCLDKLPTRRVSRNRCHLSCQDEITQSCGDGNKYMTFYETVSEERFEQYSDPTVDKQCAVLKNAKEAGTKRLKSEECNSKQGYICEYDKDSMSNYVTPGGQQSDFQTARNNCLSLSVPLDGLNLSVSLAGTGAINSENLHLNYPSWIEISRYKVDSVRKYDTMFRPKWCVISWMDSSGIEKTKVVDCQTRHLFVCKIVQVESVTPQKGDAKSNPHPVIDETLTLGNVSSPSEENSTTVATNRIFFDKELVTLIAIVSSCSLIILALCIASIYICIKRKRKQKHTENAYSEPTQAIPESEMLSFKSQEYNNPYDTVRDGHEYSEIGEEAIQNATSQTKDKACNDLDNHSPNLHTTVNDKTVEMQDEVFKLDENYTEPDDAVVTKKLPLTNVKSSHSYTYPYDSLDKVTNLRKHKSAV